jgi:serine incorporator 1/3
MTSTISNILCCAGNCLCHGMNNICEDSKKINPKLFARIGYILLSFFSLGVTLIILFFGSPLLKPFSDYIHCPNSDENTLDCLGISQVYRMSLALVILHLIVMLFSLCGKTAANVMNRDCWSFKFLLLFAIYIGFMFVPNSYFSIYANISRYLSLLFLICQLIITVSFAHVINFSLVEGLDETNEFRFKFGLLFLTFLFTGFSLYWIIVSFINFSDRFYNLLIILFTIIIGVGFTFISISNFVTRKRFLTSLYIFSFTTYLTWSALHSQPREEEQAITTINQHKFSIVDICVGLFYLFLALAFTGFYVKNKSNQIRDDKIKIEINPLIIESDNSNLDSDRELMNRNNGDIQVKEELDLSPSYYYFHLFMILMSVYYCMLLTNWNVIDAEAQDFKLLGHSWVAFWVKFVASIITGILYIWVMIAPVLFPDRDFDF